MKRVVATFLATVLLTGVAVAGGTTIASAEDPTFVGWTDVLPSLTTAYAPSSENDCNAGKLSCVDKAIREMQKRFDPLGASCDHNGVFALAYLRTTQTYRWATTTPGFFDDPAFVNHEDAVFASYYFNAWDNWSRGNRTAVPRAWQITFDAAKAKKVSGAGDVFLGMGSHVNRDLPYVLAGIGLVTPDGASRKPDHDAVNQFLNAVVDPLLAEVAARFDPAADDAAGPALLGYTSTFQMLASWRETAWRNAERLVNAPDATARAAVEKSIEDYAVQVNNLLVSATAYAPPVTTTASRDAFCAANNGATAPVPYTFGTPTAW
jgi:hypothetical protein